MISVVIPYLESDEGKKQVLADTVKSLKGHDELIIVWNDRKGYFPSINRGFACARGDYLIFMNDDVLLTEGDLTMLCDPKAVTSPTNDQNNPAYLWGSCVCMPRWVYEQIGGLSEEYRTSYFDDEDLILTLQEQKIYTRIVSEVKFSHPHAGRTLDSLPDRNEFFKENEQKFFDKWGRYP